MRRWTLRLAAASMLLSAGCAAAYRVGYIVLDAFERSPEQERQEAMDRWQNPQAGDDD